MTKILHVITGLATGGAELSLCRLLEARTGKDQIHAVAVLAIDGARGAELERVRATGAEVIGIGMRPALPDPRAFLRLRNAIARQRPDIVHGWMYHANLAITLTAGRRKTIWGIRQSLYDLKYEKRATRMTIRLGAKLSARPSAVVYNSDVSAKQHEAIGYRNDRTYVIPNGIDGVRFKPDPAAGARTRSELNIPPNRLVIGHVARFHPMKDHATLLRAAALFVRLHPDVTFLLAGEQVDAGNTSLNRLLQEFRLDGRVHLAGRRSDIPAVLSAMDIMTSSSAWGEAFPNVIAEAMACGIPCVATNVGDTAAILSGIFPTVPVGDPAALADAWHRIACLDSDTRQKLGIKARDHIVSAYSMPVCSDRYASLYRSLET